MREHRTLLEQKIKERRQTFEEFAEYAETFAREHGEPGTLSIRHLLRLVAGHGPNGEPLGPLRPPTTRLLERIFNTSINDLLAPPTQPRSAGNGTAGLSAAQPWEGLDFVTACEWLDEHAGWPPDTSRRKMMSRVAALNAGHTDDLRPSHAKIGRTQVAEALSCYYRDYVPDYALYQARCGNRKVTTSILTEAAWLDLACSLTRYGGLTLVKRASSRQGNGVDISEEDAINRLAKAAVSGVRVANMPLYRLLSIDTRGALTGTVVLASFIEYALTVDLLEGELIDSIASGSATRRGALPLRDRYLPDVATVLNLSGRLCAGGVLALCAIARPIDRFRGTPDYALLVQQRSDHVLNAVRSLAVIPKAFHQPMTDFRADVRIESTLLRAMEEELFGRAEVDSTFGERRIAEPMHPDRLSKPMRWLMEDPSRLRLECTGFGLNLVSGNYEFAGLIVIEDDEFWARYGGQIEANWESTGLRLYSSLDNELLVDLVADQTWSNEGLFALLQGLRRLREIGGDRQSAPGVEWNLGGQTMTKTASGL